MQSHDCSIQALAWHDDLGALRELYRVLAPGGRAIVMVPLPRSLAHTRYAASSPEDVATRWRLYGQDDHIRLYSRADFVAREAEAGFRVEVLGVEHFGATAPTRSGVTPHSRLYLAHKPAA